MAPPSLARYPNVFVKISGLITHAPTQWKAAEFPAFEEQLPPGLGELERRGLTLDVSAGFTPAIVETYPALRVALARIGTGSAMAPPSLARYPNVFVKISGRSE